MRKKSILRLFLLIVFSISLYSCVHDEIASSTDPSSKEYTNKSLWKEDEKYIKNVMKVYDEHEADIKKIGGTPYWDYASTMETYDESYVAIPIVDGDKVVSVLQVPRDGSTIHFYYTNFRNQIDFFQKLIFSKYKKALPSETSSPTSKLTVCTTHFFAVWMPNDESNADPSSGAGHWETISFIKCVQNMDHCVGVVNAQGQCETGGGGGGYPYPGGGNEPQDPEEPKDPCAKLKTQTNNPTFKSNITALEGTTGNSSESGYRIDTNASGIPQNQILQNKPGTKQVDMTIFPTTITLMHSHYDGLLPIFSPGDILLFNKWVIWAQNWNSIATNVPKIPLNNITLTVVTGNENYSFTFDGTTTTALPNYTQQEFDDLNKMYAKLLSSAVTVSNVGGNTFYNTEKLEKEFLKFMNDKMNMPGLKLYRNTESGNTELQLFKGNRKEVPCP